MTTLPTITLTDFLLARIEEDETLGRPRQLAGDEWHAVSCAVNDDTFGGSCDCDVPSRWLAECETKRRIVELHMPQPWAINCNVPRDTPICGTCGDQEWYAVAAPCPTLHALALPYADHPDYRPEWRP